MSEFKIVGNCGGIDRIFAHIVGFGSYYTRSFILTDTCNNLGN